MVKTIENLCSACFNICPCSLSKVRITYIRYSQLMAPRTSYNNTQQARESTRERRIKRWRDPLGILHHPSPSLGVSDALLVATLWRRPRLPNLCFRCSHVSRVASVSCSSCFSRNKPVNHLGRSNLSRSTLQHNIPRSHSPSCRNPHAIRRDNLSRHFPCPNHQLSFSPVLHSCYLQTHLRSQYDASSAQHHI